MLSPAWCAVVATNISSFGHNILRHHCRLCSCRLARRESIARPDSRVTGKKQEYGLASRASAKLYQYHLGSALLNSADRKSTSTPEKHSKMRGCGQEKTGHHALSARYGCIPGAAVAPDNRRNRRIAMRSCQDNTAPSGIIHRGLHGWLRSLRLPQDGANPVPEKPASR